MTYRLFAAIRPPRAIRGQLLALQGGIVNTRWQDDDQLHVTLRFFGDTDASVANGLADALGRIDCAPFELALDGVGHFEKKGVPHTLWAGLSAPEPLAKLQRRVERAARSAGLALEKRKFAPHVTIARMSASSGPCAPFLARHASLSSEPWTVEDFALYESRLSPEGARYTQLETYPLSP